MINFPNKFNPIPSSVIGCMLDAIMEIPINGIDFDILKRRLLSKMNLADMIDALVCLYAINAIEMKKTKIFKK